MIVNYRISTKVSPSNVHLNNLEAAQLKQQKLRQQQSRIDTNNSVIDNFEQIVVVEDIGK